MKWNIKKNVDDFNSIEDLINEIIKERFSMNEYIANISKLEDPFKFKDMSRAVAKLTEAIDAGKNICIYADYDVDGTTSCYTAYNLLRKFISIRKSSSKVGYYIPHREKEGYGMNKNSLDYIRSLGFDLIITVDNGIASYSEVEHGKTIGLDFIITDHHEYPKVVPNCPIINPHDGVYPFTKLSGCGTVFKMLEALYTFCGLPIGMVYEYLDVVAISTVADLMDLVGENRIIVQYGIYILNENYAKKTRPWLNKLLEKAKFNGVIDSYTIGFVIGPRINSVGRLSHSMNTMKFMLETNEDALDKYADIINTMNEERKEMQQTIVQVGDEFIQEHGVENSINIVVDGRVGVVGLAASNLLDKYYRPTTVFSSSGDPNIYKASARSIEGFDYFQEIIEKNRDIIVRGGGHSMAAGLSVKKENIDLFRQRANKAVEEVLKTNPELLVRKLNIDAEIHPSNIEFSLVKKIDQMEPYGQGNPKPVFLLRNMTVKELKGVPKNNPKHLQITVMNGDNVFKGILFKRFDLFEDIQNAGTIDLAFTVSLNTFIGKTEIQFMIEDYKKSNEDSTLDN